MAHGQLPVSIRLVRQLRDNFDDYRKTRLAQLAAARAEFEEILREEEQLLNWSRHHLDELIRRHPEAASPMGEWRGKGLVFGDDRRRRLGKPDRSDDVLAPVGSC